MSFHFKQFNINDSNCAMKVGTDAVLLGAWIDVKNIKNILDIGTGSGVITLMLAQRSPTSQIDAIDIDSNSVKQASENFSNCKWKNNLYVSHASLQKFVKNITKKFDLIISNPPYFHNMLKASSENRKTARHTDELTHEELFRYSKMLLHDTGRLCIIIPSDIHSAIKEIALNQGMYTTRKCNVFPKEGGRIKRMLLQFEFKRRKTAVENITILRKDGKEYTQEYIELIKDFYTIF